ncbi:MAG: 3',5'-cyclic-nucleotide phosphodiesterase [Pyrinomonadaceae bacterium]|nr:3',5'-cyclic-nucleotide phosphodiesterase [Pyrinomonadaceae bacterium]
MLPTTISENGRATAQQHLCCLVVDDKVAIDAGSLAMSATEIQRKQVRDVILTHAHLDHIAGLPIFIDDLFATLETPIRIYALPEVINSLETHVFNWVLYPRVSELKNSYGNVVTYQSIEVESKIKVSHLEFTAINVNHKVPSVGFVFSDGNTKMALSGDTSQMERFWEFVNQEKNLKALFIECAFPNELSDLAEASHHLTPSKLELELKKFSQPDCQIFVINLKPMYREKICSEITTLNIPNLNVLEVGKVYHF